MITSAGRGALVLVALSLATGLAACTALGPMPATTGVSAVPAGRPSGEVGFGLAPGYYLSSGSQASPDGGGLTQGALLLEPDRLVRLPGLVVGARHIGDSKNGGYFEPLAGYRCHLDGAERVSAMAIGYFTKASGNRDNASYSATRGGAEVGFDARVTPRSNWFEVHGSVSAALTGLSASGHYCLDQVGQFGTTCANPPDRLTSVSGGGLYPSATAGVSLDFARYLAAIFHGGRLGLLVTTGTMPTIVGGQQGTAHWFGAAGASLTMGFGARR